MKIYYSKSFIIFNLTLIGLFLAGFVIDVPLWVRILLLVPALEFTFHEYVHAFVAWIYNVKLDYMVLNCGNMCCNFIPLPISNPNKNKIALRIVLSGTLFQSAIYSFEVTILILSGLYLNDIIPIFFASLLVLSYFLYDILHPECDFMRVFTYIKKYNVW